MDLEARLFMGKLQDALKAAGISPLQVSFGKLGANQYHIDAVLSNKSNGGILIEDAQIIKEDYRIQRVKETQGRFGRNSG